jgi:hypothetical protein
MLHIRISATDLDALRYYMQDEESDLSALLRQLRREEPPTLAMMAGTAFHKAIEAADYGTIEHLSADGFAFELAVDGDLPIPAIREVKATRDYVVGDVMVTLVGKVDAVMGRLIFDHKLTSSFDAERYLQGLQWRVYLEIFGTDEFRWNVFEGAASAEDDHRWKVRSLHVLPMHRYPGMADDVERAVAGFVEFAKIHLPEKLERAAA